MTKKQDHPIYRAAAAAHVGKGRPFYIHLTDTAKLIRARLKGTFPGVKFSVRSKSYSGGSSIDVSWIDGPLQSAVQEVIAPYAGAGFDGMIDMQYLKGAWLLPDGTAEYRSSQGTTGSRGSVPKYDTAASCREAVPVSFCVDYVFAQRRISREYLERMMTAYARERADDLADAIRAGTVTAGGEDGYAYMEGASGIRVDDMWADTALYRFGQESHASI